MSTDTRRIFTILLSIFIIVSAFVPALNPLPTINDSTSDYSLFETFANSLDSSNSSPLARWFNQLANDFMREYASEYLIFLDRILLCALGILLIMLLIGVITAIISKKSGGSFIRITAVLNTFVYVGIILLTFYQANRLSHEMIIGYFIEISPSIGAWIGLISSFVLIFISGYGRTETISLQGLQNVMYPPQSPYAQQMPSTATNQRQSSTHAQPNIPAQPLTQTQADIQAQSDIQTQPHLQAQSHSQPQQENDMSDKPEDTQKPDNNSIQENAPRPNQNQEEQEIARLGNGYSVVIKGAKNSTGATLTDKRLYLSGELFKSDVGKKLKKTTLMYHVDLPDIVGMEFKVKRKTGFLVTAIIFLAVTLLIMIGMLVEDVFEASQLSVFFMPSVLFFFLYSITGLKLFVVHTRVGSVGLNVRIAGQAEVEKFARSILAAQNAFRVQQGMPMGVQ